MLERLQDAREHLTARRGWAIMALGIVAFEAACPQGQTLSEGVDRALERNGYTKAAVVAGGVVTLAHLINLLPEKADPYHYALLWKHKQNEMIDDLL